jgi:AcrR family transcriptional regulator
VSTFQRARKPEQMAARRAAIMAVARDMLAEKNVTEISLRELSSRVGLAKSNVLRYFDSREAIFLEVLDEEVTACLGDVDDRLGRPRAKRAGYASERRVATVIADALLDRPLLCELLGSMASILERNISYEFALEFKARAMSKTALLADLVSRHLPWLPREFTEFFAEAALTVTAGSYPFSVPTEPVRAAIATIGLAEPAERFAQGLRLSLTTWLIGAAAQTDS